MTMDLLSAFPHTPLCKQPTLPHSPVEWHSFFSFSTSCFSFNLRLPLNKNAFLIKMVSNHISNPNAPQFQQKGFPSMLFRLQSETLSPLACTAALPICAGPWGNARIRSGALPSRKLPLTYVAWVRSSLGITPGHQALCPACHWSMCRLLPSDLDGNS